MGTDAATQTRTGGQAPLRFLVVATGLSCLSGPVFAFPFIGDNTQGGAASSLSAPDAQDLKHQLDIANGLSPVGGSAHAWTIDPRLSVQEALTDNVLQVHSPMRWDLTTMISPGITVTGDTQRIKARVDYAPVLVVNAQTGDQNALNQQLNGTATVTVFEELAFIDLRALAGIQSTRGAAGFGGTIGATNIGGFTAGTTTGGGLVAGNTQQTAVQTSSIAITPYLIKNFGDYGTARLGYSLNISQSSPISGFRFLPFPTGGSSQWLVTHEGTGQYKSGDFLNYFQDIIDIDFSQTTGSGQINTATSTNLSVGQNSLTSSREIITNKLNYALSRDLTLTAMIGHERIIYSGTNATSIDDITWSFGGTWTPNDRSSITISYGRQQGEQTFNFNGYLQITTRTRISASYSDTLGTQLENLQQQLNQGTIGANGGFINGQTGGQLFGNTNALALQSGVFHFKNFTATATTQLNRDTITLTMNASNQTSAGGISSQSTSSQSNGLVLSWTHDLRPDIRLATSASYAVNSGGLLGSGRSLAFNTSLIYTLTESVSASARYSFFKNTSQNSQYDLYEDLFVLGITKHF